MAGEDDEVARVLRPGGRGLESARLGGRREALQIEEREHTLRADAESADERDGLLELQEVVVLQELRCRPDAELRAEGVEAVALPAALLGEKGPGLLEVGGRRLEELAERVGSALHAVAEGDAPTDLHDPGEARAVGGAEFPAARLLRRQVVELPAGRLVDPAQLPEVVGRSLGLRRGRNGVPDAKTCDEARVAQQEREAPSLIFCGALGPVERQEVVEQMERQRRRGRTLAVDQDGHQVAHGRAGQLRRGRHLLDDGTGGADMAVEPPGDMSKPLGGAIEERGLLHAGQVGAGEEVFRAGGQVGLEVVDRVAPRAVGGRVVRPSQNLDHGVALALVQ